MTPEELAKWGEKQIQELIKIGINAIDAERSVTWVILYLPPGADPTTYIFPAEVLNEPLDDAAIQMRESIGTLPKKFQPNTNAYSTHASPLPGYTWADDVGRYRANATGRFVARTDILGLLDAQVNATEKQMSDVATAVMEGRITPAVWQEQMRTEVKRQVIQQTALGSGGFDRISQQAYGRAGADLRQLYAKISGTATDIADGKISMAQAQARANEYAGHGRSHFYAAEREKAQPSASNKMLIERRILGGGGKTCSDCVNFYGQGWQPIGILAVPGDDSICQGHCKCRMIRQEIEAAEAGEWLGTKR